jgi:hypothetical protein
MVLIAGWGDKGRVIGKSGTVSCQNCNNSNPFNVVEQSRRVTAFFVPIIRWDYRYYLSCPVCSRGAQLKDKQAAIDVIAEGYGKREVEI